MSRYLSFLLLLFCCVSANAQNNDDVGQNTQPIITIDLGLGATAPNKIFPFDRSFTIHLKGIPSITDHIEVRIQSSSEAIQEFKSKNTTTERGSDMVLSWTRREGDDSRTEDNIYSTGYLRSNTEYIVKVSTYTKKPLTIDQQIQLKDAVTKSSAIQGVIGKIAHTPGIDPGEIIMDYSGQIVIAAANAVKAVDPTYIYKTPQTLPLVSAVGRYHNGVLTISNELASVTAVSKCKPEHVNMVHDQIVAIDWGTFKKTLQSYQDVLKELDDLHSEEQTAGGFGTAVQKWLDLKDELSNAVDARDALINNLAAAAIVPYVYSVNLPNTTYDPKFKNNVLSYITLDVGLAYVSRIDRFPLLYSGINIFFKPIDKNVPLEHYSGSERFWSRACVTMGVSLASVEKEQVRKGAIGDKAIVLAAGYRIWSFLKINGGIFAHYRYDTNPVLDPQRYHTSASPFISISVDADVKTIFSAFGVN